MPSFKAASEVMMRFGQSANALFPSGIKKTQPPTSSGKSSAPESRKDKAAKAALRFTKIAGMVKEVSVKIGVAKQSIRYAFAAISTKTSSKEGEEVHGDPGPAKIAESEISPMDVLNNSCEELMDELNFYQETLDTKQHWQLVKNALQSAAELNPKLDPINKDFIDKILKTKKPADFDINAVKSFLRRHPVNTTWHQSSVAGQ